VQEGIEELDDLVHDIGRESPQLLRMPVNSQLSAITEGDEDLTQPSSTLSPSSSIDTPRKLGKDALNKIDGILGNGDTSVCSGSEEEPNLFAHTAPKLDPTTDSQQQNSAPKSPSGENTAAPETEKPIKKKSGKRNSRKVVLKSDEILIQAPKEDDESTGDISDITEEFVQIPMTSPLFQKAMEMFREAAAAEGENQSETPNQLDELNHIATLPI